MGFLKRLEIHTMRSAQWHGCVLSNDKLAVNANKFLGVSSKVYTVLLKTKRVQRAFRYVFSFDQTFATRPFSQKPFVRKNSE